MLVTVKKRETSFLSKLSTHQIFLLTLCSKKLSGTLQVYTYGKLKQTFLTNLSSRLHSDAKASFLKVIFFTLTVKTISSKLNQQGATLQNNAMGCYFSCSKTFSWRLLWELCSTNWVLLRIILPSWTLVLHNFTNMSHYAKGTNLKSPSNGVGFYKHFPKNVIRPDRGTQELITVWTLLL